MAETSARAESGLAPAICRGAEIGHTAYRLSGAGRPLVFIHGVGMQAEIWAPQIAHFSAGRRAIAYDMLGHGGSALPPDPPVLSDYADQLLSLLDALAIERADIVGHSMGALVALEFALRNPERTLSVVAMNAVFRRTPAQREAVERRAADLSETAMAASVEPTLERWFGRPVPPHLQAAAADVGRILSSVDRAGYARTYRLFARSDEAHVSALPDLSVPALFLTGENDPNSTPSMSDAMAALAPRGRSESLPGERHMMAVVSPALVNRRIAAFLDAVDDVALQAPRAAQA